MKTDVLCSCRNFVAICFPFFPYCREADEKVVLVDFCCLSGILNVDYLLIKLSVDD